MRRTRGRRARREGAVGVRHAKRRAHLIAQHHDLGEREQGAEPARGKESEFVCFVCFVLFVCVIRTLVSAETRHMSDKDAVTARAGPQLKQELCCPLPELTGAWAG